MEDQEKKTTERSTASLITDVVLGHVWEALGGGVSIMEKAADEVRRTVVRFVQKLIISFVLIVVGAGFIIFGLAVALMQVIDLGPAVTPMMVGVIFLVLGVGMFMFARK
ncbi:MAG: hypothetical protein KC736_05140 [Candidatus Moranbacteria bacterium]|nr:hypothetical protein [Candidatus Moranbacteria bacterium]